MARKLPVFERDLRGFNVHGNFSFADAYRVSGGPTLLVNVFVFLFGLLGFSGDVVLPLGAL